VTHQRRLRRRLAEAELQEVPQQQVPAGWSADQSAALHVHGGITLQVGLALNVGSAGPVAATQHGIVPRQGQQQDRCCCACQR
jgi:hypothetical protein